MSGGAPAADSCNNLYLITGNGVFDGKGSFGDSYLRLATPTIGRGLLYTAQSEYLDRVTRPRIERHRAVDRSPTGPLRPVGRWKQRGGNLRPQPGNMGHFNSTTDAVVQSFSVSGRSFATPAFWNNTLYYFGCEYNMQTVGQSFAFTASTGLFTTTPSAVTPSTFGFPGATPSISATPSGTNGIVWAIDAGTFGTRNGASLPAGPAILHAYSATSIAMELWNSSQSETRDTAGNAVKFTVPTVANGKVYVGTRGNDDTQGNGTRFGEIDVYGLLAK